MIPPAGCTDEGRLSSVGQSYPDCQGEEEKDLSKTTNKDYFVLHIGTAQPIRPSYYRALAGVIWQYQEPIVS
jgi:hypothetical protein